MRVRGDADRGRCAFVVHVAWRGAGSAQAAIPASLKSSCATQTPHAGFSYKFCDDGLPPSGGTTPNSGRDGRGEVPAKYDGLRRAAREGRRREHGPGCGHQTATSRSTSTSRSRRSPRRRAATR